MKMCDFGFSKRDRLQSAPKTRVGTPAYIAPEIIANRAGERINAGPSDIWSCGVLLYFMLFGGYPFEHPDDKRDPRRLIKMVKRIRQADYVHPENVSPECADLFSRIFVADPDSRIQLHEIMAHPWFR